MADKVERAKFGTDMPRRFVEVRDDEFAPEVVGVAALTGPGDIVGRAPFDSDIPRRFVEVRSGEFAPEVVVVGLEDYTPSAWRAVKCKAADGAAVNNSTTFANDTELFFAVGAGETWVGRFVVFHTGDSTADIKFALTFPASTTILTAAKIINAASTAVHSTGHITTSGSSLGASGNSAVGAITEILFSCITTTAGNVTLQWAQNVLTVADTFVKAGSYIIAERVA